MIVGAATEVIAGEGCIVTAGGIDTHIHFICPQQIDEAISSGITTMLGGGTGPGDRHVCDDVHAGRVEPASDARGRGSVSDESRISRQRKLRHRSALARTS